MKRNEKRRWHLNGQSGRIHQFGWTIRTDRTLSFRLIRSDLKDWIFFGVRPAGETDSSVRSDGQDVVRFEYTEKSEKYSRDSDSSFLFILYSDFLE